MRTQPYPVMTQASTVLSELRRATADAHARLEQQLNLMTPELSLTRYRGVLVAFYGYWGPLETLLERRAAELRPAFPLRPRAELLRRDLKALGLSRVQLAELPRCTAFPRVQRLEEVAGCLYVLEGARLGGQVVAGFLRRRFGLDSACGAAFFSGNDEWTRQRWAAYLEWLAEVAEAGATRPLLVQSASETFRTLLCWVEQQVAQQGVSR